MEQTSVEYFNRYKFYFVPTVASCARKTDARHEPQKNEDHASTVAIRDEHLMARDIIKCGDRVIFVDECGTFRLFYVIMSDESSGGIYFVLKETLALAHDHSENERKGNSSAGDTAENLEEQIKTRIRNRFGLCTGEYSLILDQDVCDYARVNGFFAWIVNVVDIIFLENKRETSFGEEYDGIEYESRKVIKEETSIDFSTVYVDLTTKNNLLNVIKAIYFYMESNFTKIDDSFVTSIQSLASL